MMLCIQGINFDEINIVQITVVRFGKRMSVSKQYFSSNQERTHKMKTKLFAVAMAVVFGVGTLTIGASAQQDTMMKQDSMMKQNSMMKKQKPSKKRHKRHHRRHHRVHRKVVKH